MLNTEKILSRMKELELSVPEAAALSGISEARFRRIMRHQSQPDTLVLQRMRIWLQITPPETTSYFFL